MKRPRFTIRKYGSFGPRVGEGDRLCSWAVFWASSASLWVGNFGFAVTRTKNGVFLMLRAPWGLFADLSVGKSAKGSK